MNDYTFHEWKQACDHLPRFDASQTNSYVTAINKQLFLDELDRFLETMRKQFQTIDWIGKKQLVVPQSDEFVAHVEKQIIPSNAVIGIHGDLHGDTHALNDFIVHFANQGYLDPENPFKIIKNNFYLLFLGDYVDRGWYGAEVLYTIMRLKNENPDNILLVRGNHEEEISNLKYDFARELEAKISKELYGTCMANIKQLYNSLPLAIYLGVKNTEISNVIQCCHGGIELGYDPQALLNYDSDRVAQQIETLVRKDLMLELDGVPFDKKRVGIPHEILDINGFMWSDFTVLPQENENIALMRRDNYNGWVFEYGRRATQKILNEWSSDTVKVRSIFRAHQHGEKPMRTRILNEDNLSHPDDAGIGKLWLEESDQTVPNMLSNVAVVTFAVAPGAAPYHWPNHAFGILHVAHEYEKWRLKIKLKEL